MYLSIEEFNNIYDIPDLYNFEKPYIIRGGCKNMTIFNDHSVISSVYNMFEDVKVDVEIYLTKLSYFFIIIYNHKVSSKILTKFT